MDCVFDVQDGVVILIGLGRRLFSAGPSTEELYGEFAQWSWYRHVCGGEDIQIEAMEIPRRFDLVRNRNREGIEKEATFSGDRGDNLWRGEAPDQEEGASFGLPRRNSSSELSPLLK